MREMKNWQRKRYRANHGKSTGWSPASFRLRQGTHTQVENAATSNRTAVS